MVLVIREFWTQKSDGEMARMMSRAWGVVVPNWRVRQLRIALGFDRPSDSVPRKRGRPPGGPLGPG